MAIPDYQTLMLPVLEFAAAQEETSIKDCIAALADKLRLTEDSETSCCPAASKRCSPTGSIRPRATLSPLDPGSSNDDMMTVCERWEGAVLL